MENKNKFTIALVCVLALLLFFSGYLAGYKYSTANNVPNNHTDTIEVVHVKQDSIFVTDTVKSLRFKHIRDSIYVSNPLDSNILKQYLTLNDSLKKLNIDRFVILDTIVKKDTFNIKCNSVKSIISLALREYPRYDTTRIVTKYINVPDNSWHIKETIVGGIVFVATYITIKAIIK